MHNLHDKDMIKTKQTVDEREQNHFSKSLNIAVIKTKRDQMLYTIQICQLPIVVKSLLPFHDPTHICNVTFFLYPFFLSTRPVPTTTGSISASTEESDFAFPSEP